MRHGAPKNLKVILSFDRAAVDIQIEDDGCGFDPSTIRSVNGHYGLIGMQERVEKLGGEFQLTSAPGAGTQVRLTIPAIKSATTEHL
jgi:signal transduction histidine kinase